MKKNPKEDDNALRARVAALVAAGDGRAAGSAVLKALGPALLRYLHGLLGNRTDAEDAFSDACERIWRGLPAFRGEAALKTWTYRLAWSAAADLRKSGWKAKGRRLDTAEANDLVAPAGTASWLRDERMRLSLDDLRRHLDLEEQSLLALRLDQELSWAECAEVLSSDGEQLSGDAIMKRFSRIKERLRELIAEGHGT